MEFLKSIERFQCGIVGHEKHHDTEGEHLHAFVKLKTAWKVRTNTLNKSFDFEWNGKTFHPQVKFVKHSRLDIKRIVEYVTKDGDFIAENIDVEAIKREQHSRAYNTQHILETPIQDLVKNDEISVNQYKTVVWAQQHWKLLQKPEDHEKARGIWIQGRSGCGKSTWARAFGMDKGGLYEKPQNKWFDGYDGEKVIVLDDLDTHTLNHYLKIWMDKWACKGEMKGGTIWLYHDYFVVTSNYTIPQIVSMGAKTPEEFDSTLCDAIERRCKIISVPDDEFLHYDGQFYMTDENGNIVPKVPEHPELGEDGNNHNI